MKKARTRLTAEARKQEIIRAARPLFAEHGFKGTSVRRIAEAAKVSEALLYKHFPHKEALYQELFKYSLRQIDIVMKRLKDLKAGSETIVIMVYAVYLLILIEMPGRAAEQRSFERLLFHSLLDDAGFARALFRVYHDKYMDIFTESLVIAIRQGDVVTMPVSDENRVWFAHHLAMGLDLCFLTGSSAYGCRLTRDELVNEGVIYSLRGMGMTDEAIRRYFKPDKLREYVMSLAR